MEYTYDENKIKQYENIEDKLFVEYVIKQCVTSWHYYTLQKRKYMIKTHNSLFHHMDKTDTIIDMIGKYGRVLLEYLRI